MATYTEISALAKDSAFQGKLTVAVTKFASFILGESTATSNHTKRWNWASQIARGGPESAVGSVAMFVAFDSTIQANLGASTDAQIQAAFEAWIAQVFQL